MAFYRPLFRSQFDYEGVSNAYESHNCVFAAGAMLLDRHTIGAMKVTPQYLRLKSPKASRPVSAGLDDLKVAWRRAAEDIGAEAGFPTLDLNWARRVSFEEVISNLSKGTGAVILGNLQHLPNRYMCTCPRNNPNARGNCSSGAHALYLNEVREDGDVLAFDPLCRPTDNLGNADRDILDQAYANETKETQPHWIPQRFLRDYGSSFTRTSNKVTAAFSRPTGGATGTGVPGGDAWVVHSPGYWEEVYYAPAQPGELATISKEWQMMPQVEGFVYNSQAELSIANPERVIAGEEGRVNAWNPAADGYGQQGRAYYKVAASAFKTRQTAWHLRPWDIPIESFYLKQPQWPDGEAYLKDLLSQHNRHLGQQAIQIVNRGNIWEEITLGAYLTLDLGLQGPHPSGLVGTVRVVGIMPDEDAGTMQLLCEWADKDDDSWRDDTPPDDDNDPNEPDSPVDVPEIGDPKLKFYSARVDDRPRVNNMEYAFCTLLRWLGYILPREYGMTLRRASGVPLRVNGQPWGTTIADTKESMRVLYPDEERIIYGYFSNQELLDKVVPDVVRVHADMGRVPRHLRRWTGGDWPGYHAVVIAAYRETNRKEVFWMDPMGKPSTGYRGEWVGWDDVKNALLRNADGIRVTSTDS